VKYNLEESRFWQRSIRFPRGGCGCDALEHENAKAELKGLMPEDAKEAIGRPVRAKRSKSDAVSFDLLGAEGDRAALQ
jgi:hypothetical protein